MAALPYIIRIGLNIAGFLRQSLVVVSTSTTLSRGMVLVKQSQGGITSTLWANPIHGDTVSFRNAGENGQDTFIDGNGNAIEDGSEFRLANGESITLVWDSVGSTWTVF
jgi:hypothetical protein